MVMPLTEASRLDHGLGNVLTVVVGNLALVADDLALGRPIDPLLVERALAAARRGTQMLAELQSIHRAADPPISEKEPVNGR